MEATQIRASLDTVIIYTNQMEKLAKFYEEALQIGPYEELPGHKGKKVGSVYFGFDQVGDASGISPSRVTLWFTVDDINAAFDKLVSLGAKVRSSPTKKPWGAVIASVYDPDGNIVGLAHRKRSNNSESITEVITTNGSSIYNW